MSLIALAAEFFDRMANPGYGSQVNEEYALRFARLMDAESTSRMAQEVRQVRSASALSAHGWSWLLSWVRTRPDAQLNSSVLLDLCERWESVTFKAEVIRTALSGADRRGLRERRSLDRISIDSLPDPWLRNLLFRTVRPAEVADESDRRPDTEGLDEPTVHSRHSHSLLMALILVETDESLDAAAALLRYPWTGQESLLSAYWARVAALDNETRDVWTERLQPPPDRRM